MLPPESLIFNWIVFSSKIVFLGAICPRGNYIGDKSSEKQFFSGVISRGIGGQGAIIFRVIVCKQWSRENYPGGNFPRGQFSSGAIVLGGSCSGGNCPGGNCPGDNYPGGNFPRGQLSGHQQTESIKNAETR